MRDVPTMEDPHTPYGRFGNHAEIVYRDVRVPVEQPDRPGGRRASCWPSSGWARAGSTTACAGSGQSRRAFDMLCERAVSRYAHGSMLAEKQTIQNWVADSLAEMQAARLMTLHAAWKMDQEGAPAARVEIAMIKYYGATVLYNVIDRALQVHGSLGFSSDLPARVDVPGRPGRPHLRRARRGAPPDGGPPGPEGLRGRTRCRPSTSRPGGPRRSGASPTCSTR